MTKQTYKSADVWLSAFLRASGQPLLSTEQVAGQILFVFPAEAEILTLEYYNGKALPINIFRACFKELRNIIDRSDIDEIVREAFGE